MRNFIIIIVSSILILAFGFILYFNQFNGNLSVKSDEWANFASFNGYFINILSLFILGYISYITYNATNNFNKLQTRPLLYLTIDSPTKLTNFKDSWYVVNGANYPAINLLVRYTFDRNSNEYSKWVSCTSLSGNDKKELLWIHWADKIEICYSDLTQEKFYLMEYLDHNAKNKPLSKKEYLSNYNDAIANRENNIIALRDKVESYLKSETKKGNKEPMKNYNDDFIKPLLFSK